ncbi:MAG: outer membrane beta-barrel protein [Methylocystis sp.]
MKWSYLTSVAAAALLSGSAFAADVDLANKKAPPAPPPSWWDAVTITGYLEGSETGNFANPYNGLNWGRLFDDRADGPMFNQGILTVQRPLDPKATDYDFGFKVQGMVGEDARYTHFLGELDYSINSRTQLDVVEAHLLAHLPWVTQFSQGGIDVKLGQWVTLLGAEVISAPDNPFFSHSYIFNFGIPLKDTGLMTITHVNSTLDIYAGITSGVNTSLGWPGDNNAAPAFEGGIGLNLLDGSLTVLATTHIGPENPKQLDPLGVGWPNTPQLCGCGPSSTLRFLNDATITWKATDSLTFITDLNYAHDDGWDTAPVIGGSNVALNALGINSALIPQRGQGVSAYGVAQYVTYKINDMFKIGGRFEVFRDNNNFFVAGFPGYNDFLNAEHGYFNPSVIAAGPQNAGTTYMSFTVGTTITPELPKNPYVANIILRPEVRWDTTLNNTTPFAGGTKKSQVTFGFDAIVPFTLK